jgi:prophage maintenance system killer protein
MHSLAGHPRALVDGNKQLALLATAVFLRINDYRLDMTDDDAFDRTATTAS